jgi:hypothetical protein
MLSMKRVAAALVLVASAADVAVPVLIAPALVLGASTVVRAAPAEKRAPPVQVVLSGPLEVQREASQPSLG